MSYTRGLSDPKRSIKETSVDTSGGLHDLDDRDNVIRHQWTETVFVPSKIEEGCKLNNTHGG